MRRTYHNTTRCLYTICLVTHMENSFPGFCPKKYYFSLYNDLKVELKCFFFGNFEENTC